MTACQRGDEHAVAAWLADPTCDVNLHREAPFRAACSYGHAAVVRQLLDVPAPRAVNVHEYDGEAIFFAARNGHVNVLQVLAALTGQRRVVFAAHECLFWACACGQTAVADFLLQLRGPRRELPGAIERAMVVASKQGHAHLVTHVMRSLRGNRCIPSGTSCAHAWGDTVCAVRWKRRRALWAGRP